MKLLIAPHDDDQVLFAAYACMREKPLILVVTDAYIQAERGEKGCDAETRARESLKAAELLGCPIMRLRIPDSKLGEEIGEETLYKVFSSLQNFEVVYAPAWQGGNRHHDMVSWAAGKAFGDLVVYYTTYSPRQFFTEGIVPVIPTLQEIELKNRALACFKSQINLPATQGHFQAVKGQYEWLM